VGTLSILSRAQFFVASPWEKNRYSLLVALSPLAPVTHGPSNEDLAMEERVRPKEALPNGRDDVWGRWRCELACRQAACLPLKGLREVEEGPPAVSSPRDPDD